MRTHFLDVNHLIVKDIITNIYLKSLEKFKSRLIRYYSEELSHLIPDLKDVLKHFENEDFMNFFINWNLKILEKIRYITIIEHSNECVIRATFDIIFKFALILIIKFLILVVTQMIFKKLQFDILNDCNWKIRIQEL